MDKSLIKYETVVRMLHQKQKRISVHLKDMKKDEPVNEVARALGIIALKDDQAELNRKKLADKINELISTDLQQLIAVLYRMDVSENKLRSLLKENPGTDAGLMIADLMIERQAQKIRSRQQFRQRDDNIDENEKW